MSRTKLAKYNAFKSDPMCFEYYWGQEKTDLLNKITNLANGKKIFLELCSGYCEYSLEFAKNNPDYLCIAIDIKEDRLYSGLRLAKEQKLENFICLRLNIGHISDLFENYVDIIYLVHPDPQVNNKRKRLNQTRFIQSYADVLKDNGKLILITDNEDFFGEYLKNNHMAIDHVSTTAETDSNVIKILPTRYNSKFINQNNLTKIGIFKK
jgi:tRNA (guanine-N7-)-methyltransferase